jgi:hypothetical protein
LAAYLFMNLGTQAIKDYSDPAAIAIIFVSILVICGVLRIHNQAPVAPIMYALGTPLGLLCVSLGVWAIFWGWDGDAGIELLGFNTTLILLPALWAAQSLVWVIYGWDRPPNRCPKVHGE